MTEQLKRKYSVLRQINDPYIEFIDASMRGMRDKEINNLLTFEGGSSFSSGLYRIHTLGSSCFWTSVIGNCFPLYENKIHCISFDWLGRLYAKGLDNNIVYMFDAATVKAYELKSTIREFHSIKLIDHSNEILNEDYFENWLSEYGRPLDFNECVGFITPLYLGGEDQFYNYEIIDMEVNWQISIQIYNQVKNLPEKAIIDKVRFKQ